ncbi:HAD family hydrolase [Laceyella tengchongensis]|jgi:phosphoglycolate phosphatase
MKAIIFDLDGTLFQTEKVGVPAFRETFVQLRKEGLYDGEIPSNEKIQSVFGMTHEELWETLLPEASEEVRHTADQLMLAKELELFEQGVGQCYPGVEETLPQLIDQGWSLFIASNGVGPYVRGALSSKGLISLFKGIYTAGDYETETKVDLVRICKETHGITQGYMVGDRQSDVRAGLENGLVVIGCRYTGFPQFGGEEELQGADMILSTFSELPSLVNRL